MARSTPFKALLALLPVALLAQIGPSGGGGSTTINAYTVATLPASAASGTLAIVTNALTAGSCSSGGGSALSLCRWSGAAWTTVGGSGGSGTVINTYTVSTLPVAPANATIALVTDANPAGSCTTGGGTGHSVCQYATGSSSWVPIGAVIDGSQITTGLISATRIPAALGNTTSVNGTSIPNAATLMTTTTGVTGLQLPATAVQTNQANTFGSFAQNFAGASLVLPAASSFAASSSNQIGLDSATFNPHIYTGSDAIVATLPASASILNGHCTQWVITGSLLQLGDSGAACGTGGGGGGGLTTGDYSTTVTAQSSPYAINASTHGQGLHPIAACFDNSSPAVAYNCGYTVDASGNLSFYWNGNFSGTLVVTGGGAIPSTVVQTNQNNTWTAGTQSFAGVQHFIAFSGAAGSKPSACSLGEVYLATDATAGQNWYFCTTAGNPGTWTQQKNDGSSGGNQTTVNGQTCLIAGSCNANAGAATHSVSINEGAGAAIGGVGPGTTGQILRATTSADPAYIDYPDVRLIPAANCNNVTGGAGWSIGQSGTVTCRAGTNNKGGYISITRTASSFATFQIALPEDWDSANLPYIRFHLASTDSITSDTIIPTIQVACYKGDGSTTDDVAANAAHSLSTVTLNGNANRFWSTANVQMNSTDMTGCSAGSLMQVTVGRSASDTATNAEFYAATITIPRLLAVQAN